MHTITFQPSWGCQIGTYCCVTDIGYKWGSRNSKVLDDARLLSIMGDGTPQTSAWYFTYQLTKLGIKVISIEEIRPNWWKVTFGSNTFIPDK